MEPPTPQRSLVVMVQGGADALDRVSEGLTVAAAATSAGVDVSVWLAGEAVWLVTSNRTAGLELAHGAPLDGVLDLLISEATVWVCEQCASRRTLATIELLPGVELASTSTYVDQILQPNTQALVF